MKRIVLLLMVVLMGCDREYSQGDNYQYTFMALYDVDQWGIKSYGGHQFITDEPIQDMESFKECYVNFLDWYMGNDIPKKVYYQDHKNVTITFDGTTPIRFTLPEVNNCQ